ncbi:MAG TPA: acyl carrier protein [Acidimicrobiales bacterium]|nr:acyl carrier protein [Acidimicrobiales bacterium]
MSGSADAVWCDLAGCTTGEELPAETHVEKGPIDRKEVFELIRDQLADILEIDPSKITESASFGEDLDADSLALIELVEALEDELGERTVGFRIEDEDLEDLRTVRDAVDYVLAKLGVS